MENIETKEVLTEDELNSFENRAIEIGQKENCVVHFCPFINPQTFERYVVFLREPSYMTKLYALDKVTTHGLNVAAEDLRQACIMKEYSDPITYSDANESDPYKLGTLDFIKDNMVKRYIPQLKKN